MNNRFQKLTSTAYKIVDFFPESDPLKNKAKERVLAIMSALGATPAGGESKDGWMAVGEYFSAEREKKKIQVLEDIDILLGYFEVAKGQGWLSAINCLIICNEYEKIKNQIYVRPEVIREPEPNKFFEQDKEEKIEKFTARQGEIINYLTQNEKAQVMDLQGVLPNVTKRTIRRDLDELLKMSKIQRFGQFNQVFYKIRG